MNVTVVGATGPTGRLLLHLLTKENKHAVTVLARRPDALGEAATSATVVEGDATDSQIVEKVVLGADVIINLVAAPLGEDPGTVRSDVTRTIVESLIAHNRDAHLIVVSSLGGTNSFDQLSWMSKRVYQRAVGPERLAEVDRQERIVAESGLTATIVRPPRLDDKPPTGPQETTKQVGVSASMHRGDLARYLVDQASSRPDTIKTVTVTSQ